MTRIFITGSTEGLGSAAALALLDDGHEVFLHARNPSRAASMGDLADRGSGVVIGDLGSAEETHDVADQVNAIGRMDAVIHNAGIYIDSQRVATPRGTRAHAGCQRSSALRVDRRDRASRPTDLYISSDMHHGGDVSLHDIDWSSRQWRGVQAYSDSKLFVATLAFSVSRRLAQRKASYGFGRRGGPRGDARHALAAFVLELTDRRTCFCERFRCCRPASSVRFERV
jgi:NAD(P)-dependent dehydrogenase (short-subunit alcohol dehydrogenase family)